MSERLREGPISIDRTDAGALSQASENVIYSVLIG